MSVQDRIAKTAGKTFLGEVGAFFQRLGTLGRELMSGEWVTRESWSARTGVNEKLFRNGVKIVETPGAASVATVPDRWLAGKDGLITQLREGSWITTERTSFRTGVTEKVFRNGVKVVEAPGRKPVVTLPKRYLTSGGGKI